MRFGLFFLLEKPADGNDVDVYSNTMEQIRLADELGYDYIWLAEHRFTRYGIAPDVLVLAAAAASVTRHVRIGTAVIVLPFHNPIPDQGVAHNLQSEQSRTSIGTWKRQTTVRRILGC
ncbi:MAG: LLM class flavin-dependent oxidoreductase [Gemmatimonadetes bacterium]|nr:LLM class flavin-dependent oxidoreductase [Gemmatimonadota bacterium]